MKRLPKSNLFLLPVKASEVTDSTDNMTSMSTTVKLAFVLQTANSNTHQDFLNRSVSFILRDETPNVERRRDDIESALSQITGGHVRVYAVHPALEQPGSVVHAWILYPSKGTVDLRNLQKVASAILGQEAEGESTSGHNVDSSGQMIARMQSNNQSIDTAATLHHQYQTVVWVLIFFVLLIFAFLVSLCCIWCWCCRSPAQLRVWLNGSDTKAPVAQSTLLQHPLFTEGRSLEGLPPMQAPLFVDSQGADKRASVLKYHDKVRKIRPPRQGRAKLKHAVSRSTTTLNTEGVVSGGNSQRTLDPSMLNSLQSSFEEDEDLMDEDLSSRRQADWEKSKRTEIMYIRSPPESLDERQHSVSEADVGDHDEDHRSGSQRQRRSSTKQVSFRMQRLSSSAYERLNSGRVDSDCKRKRSPSNETILSADLVSHAVENSGASTAPQTRRIRLPVSSSSSASDAGTVVCVPGTVDDLVACHEPRAKHSGGGSVVIEECNKSDTDSGIGRGGRGEHVTQLNIRNKGLMEKKDIFAIAYDGVRTQRIRSSDSDSRDSL